jgi:hypothetical protein
LVQEYDIQRLSAQCSIDESFGKLTLFEVICSKILKVSGFEMSFFSSSCIAFHSISIKYVSVIRYVVNLLFYLADQLLRGCQSADNQVQALQNQVTEGFLVHGSRLPELEAEVIQIQPFVRISLHYLISVDQQDLVLGGFLVLSFGPLVESFIFLLFWILESFCLWILYTLFTLVLLRH